MKRMRCTSGCVKSGFSKALRNMRKCVRLGNGWMRRSIDVNSAVKIEDEFPSLRACTECAIEYAQVVLLRARTFLSVAVSGVQEFRNHTCRAAMRKLGSNISVSM